MPLSILVDDFHNKGTRKLSKFIKGFFPIFHCFVKKISTFLNFFEKVVNSVKIKAVTLQSAYFGKKNRKLRYTSKGGIETR